MLAPLNTSLCKVLSYDLGELVESGHWDTVTEYIMAAWEVVTMTPVWEESVHNNTRNTCFRLLAQTVMKVTKHKDIDPMTRRKMVEMITSTVRDVEFCRDALSQTLSLTPK